MKRQGAAGDPHLGIRQGLHLLHVLQREHAATTTIVAVLKANEGCASTVLVIWPARKL